MMEEFFISSESDFSSTNSCSEDDGDDDRSGPLVGTEKNWDVFQSIPPAIDTGSSDANKWMKKFEIVLLLFFYMFSASMIFFGGVISKGTTMFMIAQVSPLDRRFKFCNHDRIMPDSSKTYDVDFTRAIKEPEIQSLNFSRIRETEQRKVLETEQVAWIWCLILGFCGPELLTFFRSVRSVFFKGNTRENSAKGSRMSIKTQFRVIFVIESLHTIGLAILVFLGLPQLDSVRALALTNCLAFFPGLLKLSTRLSIRPIHKNRRTLVALDVMALVVQLSGSLIWPIFERKNLLYPWAIPIGLLLTSIGWWECYVDSDSVNSITILGVLYKIRKALISSTRYKIYLVISLVKIVVFFFTSWLIVTLTGLIESPSNLFTLFIKSFGLHFYKIIERRESVIGDENMTNPGFEPLINALIETPALIPLWILLAQILSSYFVYIFAKVTCQVQIQSLGFAFPIALVVPSSISIIITACGLRANNECTFFNFMPRHLFFECPPAGDFLTYLWENQLWLWICWYLSYSWIVIHLWFPKSRRLASTEQIFGKPMYSGLMIDQSVTLNRRRDGQKIKMAKKPVNKDGVTKIYACATLWHENRDEMLELLKSLFRIDQHHHIRKISRNYFDIVDDDYYEWETHILFDDAFDYPGNTFAERYQNIQNENGQINSYVRTLLNVIDEAGTLVHCKNIKVKPPKKYPVPYGGRLVWTLPGGTKIICHLKDKEKIRHKKRWSQCMYMYYLLGYKLMDASEISDERKDIIAENTYLLALDGDIDFQPEAVHKLVDLMKKDPNLGAACGRIHPLGSGFMNWYQKFEYAIGHWLQKSTEDVMGCVLCSPGCFSLFRAKALMDHNVMKTYTTVSEKPIHFVQYDQGEDRWLCTLLLQQGWRVAYSAASDAFTFAPEHFNEFFNQRRRWMPSTLANIVDLLSDYKRVVKNNKDISSFYIAYQMMLLVGTVLGPGTIFLMLVGAFSAAFGFSNLQSFLFNLIPIIVYMGICFRAPTDLQLFLAQILSALYALVMMAVMVGIMLQISEDGLLAPTTLSFFLVAGSFVISAALHPQEINCLPYGVIYYVTIPAMYLLLVIYSIFNLNIVSWGTRDSSNAQKMEQKKEEETRVAADGLKKENKGGMSSLQKLLNQTILTNSTEAKKAEVDFSFSNFFRCMCFVRKDYAEEARQKELVEITSTLEIINKRLTGIETAVTSGNRNSRGRRSSLMSVNTAGGNLITQMSCVEEDKGFPRTDGNEDNVITDNAIKDRDSDCSDSSDVTNETVFIPPKRNFLKNPFWIEDPALQTSSVHYVKILEIQFWQELIKKYLKPLDKDPKKEEKSQEELLNLRNQMVFTFFMLNAIFVTVVFLLQQQKDLIFIQWPFGSKPNITFIYSETNPMVEISYEYLQLEPIGFVFIVFFAVVLVIQILGMLYHRLLTVMHIIATIQLNICVQTPEDKGQLRKNIPQIVKAIIVNDETVDDVGTTTIKEEEEEEEEEEYRVKRRMTVAQLKASKKQDEDNYNLDQIFRKKYLSFDPELAGQNSNLRRLSSNSEMMKTIVRRQSIFKTEVERRKSAVFVQRENLEKPKLLSPIHAYSEDRY